MPMLLALLMFLGGAYYFTNPDERARFFGAVLRVFRQVMDAASHLRAERGPFGDALRARTPLAVVTPVLVGLNVVVFVLMLFGAGALSDPQTVVGWGGSVGPRTTNGEWWRLVTAMFVHSGPLHLIANIVGLVQIGLIVERLFGRFAFATVYLSAGLISGLVSLSLHPVNVSGGASASILGIYGLFVAVVIAGHVFHSPLTIPPMAVLKVLPGAGVFILYSLAAGFDGTAELAGLGVGFVYGLVLAKDVGAHTSPPLRVGATVGVVLVLALAAAVPLRGLADVRPEMARVAAIEHQTAGSYDTAVRRFTRGEISIAELTAVIERAILPELRAARARLKQLGRVPREQEPLVMAADEYFKLREESWRARAAGLRRTTLTGRHSPDDMERASLQALEKIESLIANQ
jgi:membrane associated rhomboid family serine protease